MCVCSLCIVKMKLKIIQNALSVISFEWTPPPLRRFRVFFRGSSRHLFGLGLGFGVSVRFGFDYVKAKKPPDMCVPLPACESVVTEGV